MPIIQAWKCPRTGLLFEHTDEYLNHLRVLAAASLEQKRAAKIRAARTAWFTNMREQITNFDEFKQFLFDNWEYFCRNAHDHDWVTNKKQFNYDEWRRPAEITLSLLRYSQHRSNSHGCPIGGVTNWGGDKPGAPRGYPGWHAQLEIKFTPPANKNQNRTTLLSNYFSGSSIHCGSGSGGTNCVTQEVTFWASDWPTMSKIRDIEQMALRIVGDDKEARALNAPTVP
jgi:hypothetical protein